METVAAIFFSPAQIERASLRLAAAGIPPERLRRLTPSSPEETIHTEVPTTDAEAPGAGRLMGALIGAVAGATAVLACASLLFARAGEIPAAGLLAAAAAALVGGTIGGSAGRRVQARLSRGLPKDEIYFYEAALRRGRHVLFVLAADRAEARKARRALAESGAESLDAARHRLWPRAPGSGAAHSA